MQPSRLQLVRTKGCKGARAHMQCQRPKLHAPGRNCGQERLVEVQPGGRRRYRALFPGKDRLVALPVARNIIPTNVGW